MNRLRRAAVDTETAGLKCCRCARGAGRWDQIGANAFCPQCQEALALGEAEPLVERTVKNRCAVCDQEGTIRYLTYPLEAVAAVEMDLCPEHLRCLVGRQLGPFAYHQLRRQFDALGIPINDVFLLHDAFYDLYGRALHPVTDVGLAS